MEYQIKVSNDIHLLIKHLHPDIKKKIRYGFDQIMKSPNSGKHLRKELEGLQSYKISKYRIIYRKRPREIEIIAVGPRKNIYKETARLIKNSAQRQTPK